jgi:predicted transglutaminase-like cysteine proteinase
MRRQKSQKALDTLNNTIWNSAWQAFCPWIAGSDINPQHAHSSHQPKTTRRRRGARLAALLGAMLVGALLQTATANAASYDGGNGVLQKASINRSASIERSYTPQLFGRSETRHTDLSPFTKWTGVLNRFKRDFDSSVEKPQIKKWLAFLGSLEGKSDAQKISAVNDYLNKVKFIPDSKNYGMRDYWATPAEFLSRGGDCEDYAVTKYISLLALGVPKSKMRIAIVQDYVMNMPHALLVVYQGATTKILDNQNPAILDSADISRYKPIYSISQVAWWKH